MINKPHIIYVLPLKNSSNKAASRESLPFVYTMRERYFKKHWIRKAFKRLKI